MRQLQHGEAEAVDQPAGDADRAAPIRSTIGHGTPALSAMARHTIASAMIEPTDRSMPAVTMTTNMPSASRASVGVLLDDVGEVADRQETFGCVAGQRIAIMTMTTTMMP